ncbi:hypothetical protein Pelo_2162 [Pelomyxa schiedti]|nr:hypothetical protein Pelo_2162 [Pelomyxa schiedti]
MQLRPRRVLPMSLRMQAKYDVSDSDTDEQRKSSDIQKEDEKAVVDSDSGGEVLEKSDKIKFTFRNGGKTMRRGMSPTKISELRSGYLTPVTTPVNSSQIKVPLDSDVEEVPLPRTVRPTIIDLDGESSDTSTNLSEEKPEKPPASASRSTWVRNTGSPSTLSERELQVLRDEEYAKQLAREQEEAAASIFIQSIAHHTPPFVEDRSHTSSSHTSPSHTSHSHMYPSNTPPSRTSPSHTSHFHTSPHTSTNTSTHTSTHTTSSRPYRPPVDTKFHHRPTVEFHHSPSTRKPLAHSVHVPAAHSVHVPPAEASSKKSPRLPRNISDLQHRELSSEDYETLLKLDEKIPNRKGARKDEIASLELIKAQAGSDTECSICLDNIQSGQMTRVLPCEHTFHQKCIDKWLMQNRTCPVCKSSI